MDDSRSIWRIIAACSIAAVALSPALAAAQQKYGSKQARHKIERLACMTGTEDQHARIAVELVDGKVNRFAYYSKRKPRTCSMEVRRDDAYSRWADHGPTTTILLIEEKGIFFIDHGHGRYHFTFSDVDRVRYCGMGGKINGYLTISKGSSSCAVEGMMDGED